MRGSRGPTAIEAAIVAAIVAVGGAVAVANARSRRIDANESSAIVALSRIAAAQEQFQAAAYADMDQDGIGEYGLLRELTGRAGVRWTADGAATGDTVPSPLLDATFRRISRRGELRRAGYRIHVVLPGAAGVGVVEHGGALPSAIDADLAETTWGCFAWPEHYGVTGERTFFVNQTETIVGTKDHRYSGANDLVWYARRGALLPGAPFAGPGDPHGIAGEVAVAEAGRDGNPWHRVEPDAAWSSGIESVELAFRQRESAEPIPAVTFSIRPSEDGKLLVEGRGLTPGLTGYFGAGPRPSHPYSFWRRGPLRVNARGEVSFELPAKRLQFDAR